MSDVNKNVEIAINIIGGDPKVLKGILTAFENVSTAVKTANTSIDSFKTSIGAIKESTPLKNIAIALKSLEGLKAPNITSFTNNLVKLNGITLPSLTSFVTQITKLSGTKIPSLVAFQNSLVALAGLKKLPDFGVLADNLKKLTGIGSPANFTAIVTSLKSFAGTKIPSIATFINSLEKLKSVDLSSIVVNLKLLNSEIERLNKAGGLSALKTFATDISALKTALNKLPEALGKTTEALGKTSAAVAKAKKESKEARTGFDAFGESLKSFVGKLKTVAQFRTISDVLVLIKQGFTSGAKAIVEYDQALKDLQAITGATTVEIGAMGATILDIASNTKFSASEVAAGMRTIGQAGFAAAEAVQTMQAVSDLATGTLSDMSSSVDLVTTAMRVFRIDASESSMVSDVFANAVNKSKLTIDKLRTAMNYVGPVARDAGIGFQELTAAMGVLANSGLRPSSIGTGLRQAISVLIDPTEKLIIAAKNAGVALSDLDPRSNSLSSVLSNLNLVIKDSGTAFDIFGKRGASAALALSSSQSGFEGMLDTISKQGTAAKQASIQMEGLGVSFKNLQDKLKNLAIALGDAGLTGAFRVLINLGRNVTDMFTAIVSSPIGKFILGLTGVLTALGAVLAATFVSMMGVNKVFAFFTVEATAATGSVSGFSAAMAFASGVAKTFYANIKALWAILLANPIVAVGIAVAALTLYFINLGLSAKESAAELEAAAASYKNLTDKFDDYKTKIASMVQGSDELTNANKNMRTELFAVANKYTEIAPLALAAAHSINAVTGEVTDGSVALDAYNAGLDALRLAKLVEAGQNVNKVFDEQYSIFNRLSNGLKTLASQTKAWVTGKLTEEMKLSAEAASEFAKKIADGTVSIKEINDYILNLDFNNLNAQQKDIINNYATLSEQASKAIKYLEDTGQISLQSSVEAIKELAMQAGFSGRVLEEMVLQVENLQKASNQNFGNIIEKWDKDGTDAIVDAIAAYKELGGAITDIEEAQIRKNATDKKVFVEELNNLKAARDAQIEAGADYEQVWREYHVKRLALEKEANKTAIELNNNRAAENIKAIQKEKANLEKTLKEIEVTYAGSSKVMQEARIKAQVEALAAYKEKEDELLQGIVLNQKELALAYKSHLEEIKTAHSAYIEDLAIQESKGLITNEEFNQKKLEAAVKLYAKLLEEAKKYIEETPEGDSEEYEKRYADMLKAEQSFHKAKFALIIAANKEALKEQKEAQKQLLSDQESTYKEHLQKLETANAGHINELALQESKGAITTEEFNRQKLVSTVDLYKQQLEAAKKYQNQISEVENPEEYKKRGLIVLKIEESLLKARLQKNISHNKELKKEQEEAQKERQEELKSLHTQYLQELQNANTDYLNGIAIEESKGLVTSEEANTKKLKSTILMYAAMLVSAKKYQEGVAKGQGDAEYKKAIAETKKAEEALSNAKVALEIDTNKRKIKAAEEANKEFIAMQKKTHLERVKDAEAAEEGFVKLYKSNLANEYYTQEKYDIKIGESKRRLQARLIKEAKLYKRELIYIDGDTVALEEERNNILLEAKKKYNDADFEIRMDAIRSRKEAEKKALADQEAAYKKNYDELIAAHAAFSEEKAAKEELTKNAILSLDVQLKEGLLKLAIKNRDQVAKLNDTDALEKANSLILKSKTNLSNAEIRLAKYTQKESLKASKDRADKEKFIREESFRANELAHKLSLESMETEHSKYIDNLAIQESKGLINNEEFNAKKLAADVEMYDRKIAKAKEYQNSINEIDNPDDYAKGLIEIENLTQKHYKAKLAYDLNYNKAAAKTKEDLYNLETSYNEKKLENERALAEKLKDIDQEIADNKKSIASDIAGIETSTEEKIRNIRNRSKTEEQKDTSDRLAAYKYLADGKKLLIEAEREGDEEKLSRATSLIKMSESLAGGLKSENTAVDILNKSMSALKDARNVKGELKELELLKKKNEEVAKAAQKQADEKKLYETKVSEANKAFDIIKKLEEERHAREMANIKAENDLRIRNAELRAEYAKLGEDFYLTESEYIKQRGVELDSQNKAQISEYGKFIALEKEKAKIAKDAADYVAGGGSMSEEEYIKSATEALKKKSEEIAKSGVEQDNANEKLKKSTEYIIEQKDGYYQVTEQVKSATDEIEKFNKSVEGANDKKVNVDWTGSGSETLPITEKISSIKQMITDFVNENYDKVINITLDGVSTAMSQLDSLINKISEIKDKTVTITTKYKSTGDAPSGYATGGRLPGYGGGDRIPILGEAGEWIINKLAVQKYGDNFLSQLNSMSLPKFQNGGSISPSSIVKQSVVNNNGFGGFADFGKVIIDNGKTSFPVIAHRNVISELTSYMKKSSLMGANL